MKNKRNILIIFLIIIIVFAIILTSQLTLRKFKSKNLNTDISFETYDLYKPNKNIKYDDKRDIELYKDYIITEDVKRYEYTLFDSEKSVVGTIYIDDNGYLHVSSENDYDDIIVSKTKFRTMLANPKSFEYDNILIYLISEDNKLHYLKLSDSDIRKSIIGDIYTRWPVKNFTTISYNNDIEPSGNTLFVLEEDNNIFEVVSRYRYIPNVKFIFDHIMVFEDNTIANVYGAIFEDKYGSYYKIKYIFNTTSNDKLTTQDFIVVITETNELILISDSEGFEKIHVANSKVKNVEFNKNVPFIPGELVIELESGDKINFTGSCSSYFCVNELD